MSQSATERRQAALREIELRRTQLKAHVASNREEAESRLTIFKKQRPVLWLISMGAASLVSFSPLGARILKWVGWLRVALRVFQFARGR